MRKRGRFLRKHDNSNHLADASGYFFNGLLTIFLTQPLGGFDFVFELRINFVDADNGG
jgi:hypothetical protein